MGVLKFTTDGTAWQGLQAGPAGPQGPQGDPGPPGTTDHGTLTGLGDNDHPQYALTGHTHAGTYWGLWTGSQAAYDAIVTKDPQVLYVVVP